MQKTRRRTPKGLAASALRARPSSFRKTRFRLAESMATRVKEQIAKMAKLLKKEKKEAKKIAKINN